ncbi:TetR/AcrR family transcriptional regulator [Henriciella mobilis]|uniref:TetR/AcrR family transcriptional regulator n=2 Tax=Henriciella mobilis TaxID=2305467 RepID=A0A399RQT1_9PROT|nr:TetR/AcrR family transcriptional regulator [Henriciella mobilis]
MVQKDCAPMTGAEKRRAARIDQVLDAAADCFVEYGFHNAGMAKIAKRAGMSVGHIYHYFENKEAIIAAIVDRESALSSQRFLELEAIAPSELAEAMADRAARSISDNSDIIQSVLNMEMLAEGQRNPEIAKIIQRHDEHVRKQLIRLFGEKLGLCDAEARADMLMVVVSGLASRVLRHPGLDRAKLVPVLRQTLIDLMSPGPICKP